MYIEVNGPRAEAQAKAIASHYGTTCKNEDGQWIVMVNSKLEDAICYDEETAVASCEEVSAATGVHVNLDDISF